MIFLVVLLYALFGFVFTLSKIGLETSAPLFLMGSRMILAGVILLAFLAVTKKNLLPPKGAWPTILLLALVNIYITNALEFWGLSYLTSAKTCFIYSLSPFASALLSYLILGERLTLKRWGGLLVGFLGFIPIFLDISGDEIRSGSFFSFSFAELAVAVAAVSSVWGWIILRGLVVETKISPLMANGWSMLIGGAAALSHSLLVESWNPIPTTDLTQFFMVTLGLIIVSNLTCYNLYGFLLKKFSATFISFVGSMTPLFSLFFGWFFLGETVSSAFWISFVLVVSGLFLFHQEELVFKEKCDVKS